MEWNYQRTESTFEEIPVGEFRVRIENAEKATSKSGKDMLVLTLAVSGYTARLWYYVVFLPETPEITNRNLTSIFDSFGITDGNFNFANWKGKVGACKTKKDEYGTKVQYFISKRKQDNLPPWKEPTSSTLTPVKVNSDDELPF